MAVCRIDRAWLAPFAFSTRLPFSTERLVDLFPEGHQLKVIQQCVQRVPFLFADALTDAVLSA